MEKQMQHMINPPQPVSYTPNEVAQMLGVKTSTVHAWLSRKEMRAIKVGHRRYITLQNIKEFREQRQTGEYVDYTYANGPVR
jgi:excisionase family DNA binding protein